MPTHWLYLHTHFQLGSMAKKQSKLEIEFLGISHFMTIKLQGTPRGAHIFLVPKYVHKIAKDSIIFLWVDDIVIIYLINIANS